MRRIITSAILITSIAFSIPLIALADDVHEESLEETLREIQQSQAVQNIRDIDCNQVANQQFEGLGEAVMETMHPGGQHEVMDQMMGGAGSEPLEEMHITMGQNYLGCSSGMMASSGGMINMMTGGMMGWSDDYLEKGGDGSMMSGFGFMGGLGWVIMIAFWILVIFGIVAIIKWPISQSSQGPKEKSSLDILKERYAKGEIGHREFEKMKKDLEK